jgi:hypothetical protein
MSWRDELHRYFGGNSVSLYFMLVLRGPSISVSKAKFDSPSGTELFSVLPYPEQARVSLVFSSTRSRVVWQSATPSSLTTCVYIFPTLRIRGVFLHFFSTGFIIFEKVRLHFSFTSLTLFHSTSPNFTTSL